MVAAILPGHAWAAIIFSGSIFDGRTVDGSVGVGGNAIGVLTVDSGSVLTNNNSFIGNDSTGIGTVTVTGTGSTWASEAFLQVGVSGDGTLNIESGGSVSSTDSFIGTISGSNGTVTVTGPVSSFTSSNSLSIGSGGTGTLIIETGSLVDGGTIVAIGSNDGGTGTVNVTGSGSNLISSAEFKVGEFGTGTLNISDGGTVGASGYTAIGQFSGGNGTVNLTGSGSSLTTTTSFFVGDAGTGVLNISDGSTVDTIGTTVVGLDSLGNGTLSVTGTGSIFTANDNLGVGIEGTGTIDISSGGSVDTVGSTVLGSLSGGSGTVTVTGSGSSLTSSIDLLVGEEGTGVLNISAGGSINTVGETVLGNQSGSSGTVTVTGSDSNLTSSVELLVGVNGTGTLNIENGGSVNSLGLAAIGDHSSGNGTVNVTGSGSSLTASASLFVGFDGTGTLNIEAGGSVETTGSTFLGDFSGSSGTVNVSGSGSILTTTDNLLVGSVNTGTLNIDDGGSVSSEGFGILGSTAGSSGTVNVTGSGSSLTSSSSLKVGDSGVGELNISGGGSVVTDVFAIMGSTAGSSGTVFVSGSDSSLISSFSLIIGEFGDGALNISAGGSVSAGEDGFIGIDSGSSGTVNVSGSGSRLASVGSLFVGGSQLGAGGIGFLRVSDGGVVSVGVASEIHIWSTGTLAGDGTVVGNVFNEGLITPGNNFGALTIDGALTLGSTSVLSFELGGLAQSFEYDFLDVSGLVTLGGSLEIFILDGFENFISPTDTFEILSSLSLTGTFFGLPSGERFLTADHAGFFEVHYGPDSLFAQNSVFLTGFVIPEPGTYGLLMGLGMLAIVMLRRRMKRETIQQSRDRLTRI